MTEFVVHSVPGSPFGRAVLATLIEKGADFRLQPVDPRSIKSGPHLALHPFGRVPILEHGGFTLYETQAILRYLDRVLTTPALAPVDARLAARMDQILGICDWYLFQGCGNVIGFQRIVGPRLLGLTPNERAIEEAMPRAHAVMAELSRLLGTKRYLVSEETTLADILAASQMDFLARTPEWMPLTAERSNIAAWFARMSARKSFETTTWERVGELAKAA